MYLSVFVLRTGWLVFYASVAVFVGLFVFWAIFIFLLVPSEERQLEAQFGEKYLDYKNSVPRWIGRP